MTTYDLVKDFNAVTGTDCTTALQNAFSALMQSPGNSLNVPIGGIFFCEAPLTYTLPVNQGISIGGHGTIKFTNPTGGVSLTCSGGDYTAGLVDIDGLIIKTAVVQPGVGFSLIQTGQTSPGPVKNIDKLTICGNGIGSYWGQGFLLDGCTGIDMSKVRVSGYYDGANYHGGGAIIQNSQANHAVDFKMEVLNFWNIAQGLTIGDKVEGVQVINSTFYGGTGISWMGGTSGLPSLIVGDCDFDCTGYGIYAKNIVQTQIHDNLFYVEPGGVGIYANNSVAYGPSDNGKIHHNIFKGFNTVNTNGIVLNNADYYTVSQNGIDNVTTGIWEQSGLNNRILDNVITNFAFKDIYDQGTGTVIRRV